jgi:hypothetical protein
MNNWDIFVGFMTNVDKNVIIKNIYRYKNKIFLNITHVTSTIFTIYNHTIYDTIIHYNMDNTIDKYISSCNVNIIAQCILSNEEYNKLFEIYDIIDITDPSILL